MLWNTGIQLFLGEFPKILPSCWPEQQSESWGKGGDTWHPIKHKTFRKEVTGGSCPGPSCLWRGIGLGFLCSPASLYPAGTSQQK